RFVYGSLLRLFSSKSRDRQLEGVSLPETIRKYRFIHTTDSVFRLWPEWILLRLYGPVHVFERWRADNAFPVHRLRQLRARAGLTGHDPDRGQLGRELVQRLDSGRAAAGAAPEL